MAPGLLVPLITAGSTIASTVNKARTGRRQRQQAKEGRERLGPRPKRKMTPEVDQNVALTGNQFLAPMPGRDFAMSQLGKSTSTAIDRSTRVGSDPSSILQAVAKVNEQENEAINRMNVQEADYRNRMFSQFRDALYRKGQERVEVFKDDARRYEQDAEAIAAMEYAGEANRQTAIDEVAGGVSTLAQQFGTMYSGTNNKTNDTMNQVATTPASGATDFKNFNIGVASPQQIRELQMHLNTLGYTVPVTGVLDNSTTSAFLKYRGAA